MFEVFKCPPYNKVYAVRIGRLVIYLDHIDTNTCGIMVTYRGIRVQAKKITNRLCWVFKKDTVINFPDGTIQVIRGV
jgi:hypothetical protein